MLSKEERKEKLDARRERYYRESRELELIKHKVFFLKRNTGNSRAYRMLILAIGFMEDQLRSDFESYEKRMAMKNNRDSNIGMVQSLNREKKKNAELEKKIENAKTSSGLFIDFVRKKLGVNKI